MKRNGQYWKQAEKDALRGATSFKELSSIALVVVARMPKPVGQVCGPISTGGLGSIEKNLLMFDKVVDHLIGQGLTIFDQVPFEDHLFRVIERHGGTRKGHRLLTDFYLPIFESGHISTLHFIHGWQSSDGSVWERKQAERLGISIVDLEPDLVTI